MLIHTENNDHPWMITENGNSVLLTNDLALAKIQQNSADFISTGNRNRIEELMEDLLYFMTRVEVNWYNTNRRRTIDIFQRISSALGSLEIEGEEPRVHKRKRVYGG